MVNEFSEIPAIIKATVAVTLIDVDRAARYYMLFNKSLKCGNLTFGMAIVLTIYPVTLNKSDYRTFASRTSTAFPFFRLTTKIRFISTSICPDIRSVRESRLLALLIFGSICQAAL